LEFEQRPESGYARTEQLIKPNVGFASDSKVPDRKLSALFLGKPTLAHTSPLEFFVAPETCPSENK
jgi:hypothetical protein